jgi:glc operon protein GlcG
MRKMVLTSLAIGAALLLSGQARAQSAPPAAPAAPMAYGEPINIETAKKAAAAAAEESKKNNWGMCIAVAAPSGDLVYFERMDLCQYASITISQHKARAAAIFKRPTKVFEDRVASGPAGVAAITLDGVIASEGGIPIVVGGKIVGAMGCSGGTGQQDGMACQAGVNALK